LEQVDHHSKLLRDMYLVERAKRMERHPESADSPTLEGIPLFPAASPQKDVRVSVTHSIDMSS
jgi:hypothetical protein